MHHHRVSAIMEERMKYRVICKCGHRMAIRPKLDCVICTWCGHYVFRTKQIEFRNKLKQALRKEMK